MVNSDEYDLSTRASHLGLNLSDNGSFNIPIYQNSTFRQNVPGVWEDFTYTRTNNPTEESLRKAIAQLDNAEFSVVFSSGLAAISGVLELMSCGDHCVCMVDVYGGTYRLLANFGNKHGLNITFVDTSNYSDLAKVVRSDTKLIFSESPSNPQLHVSDIRLIAEISSSVGAYFVIDNTMATPVYQNALDLGADIVVQSNSKYLSGLGNVVGGSIVTNNEEVFSKLAYIRKSTGACPSPMDCYLTFLGLKTLPLRMQKHSENALDVSKFLQTHSQVSNVKYLGLADHPQHELAKRQMSGFGGIVTFELARPEFVRLFFDNLNLFSLAVSFGSVESLLDYPAAMSHKDIPVEDRISSGISDCLVRLSIGLEDESDLINDLDKALSGL